MATAPAPDDASATERPEPDTEPPRLSAWVEPQSGSPDRYTIAPQDAKGIELMSRWLTAPADLVCDLSKMR